MDLDVVANRSAFAIDSERKMSGFQHQVPSGPGTAAPLSETDPIVEADEQALSKIRSMGAVAKTSAEGVAQAILADLTRVNKLRFASAKRIRSSLPRQFQTLHTAMRRQYIIELFKTANDMEASRIPVQGIQSEPSREELLLTYPTLLL